MGQVQLTVALISIGLFTVAILAFATNFAVDNNAPISLANDPELSGLFTETSGNVSSFATDSENQYQSIIETTISPGGGTTQSTGPFAVTPGNSIKVVKNILQVGYIKLFGTGSGFGIFLTGLISIIVFLFGMFVYKTLRGNPN